MITVDLNSPVPIYEQLIGEIRRKIDHGILAAGETLPTIRALASQLDVAVNTVARAYQELETQGFIKSKSRRGSVVLARQQAADGDEEKIFKEPIRRLLQKGFSRAEIEKIFSQNISHIFE